MTSSGLKSVPNLPKYQSNAIILGSFISKKVILAPADNWRWGMQLRYQVFEIPNNWSSL